MIVVKKGKGWEKTIACKGCESVLKLEATDVEYKLTKEQTLAQQYETDIEGTYYVTCVECGMQLPLKSDALPETVKSTAKGH